MVAPRKSRRVFCTVVRVVDADKSCMVSEYESHHRPSDRLPWSDPTIARLVASLQDEVRGERRIAKMERYVAFRQNSGEVSDLEPPSPATEEEFDWQEQPRWNWPERS